MIWETAAAAQPFQSCARTLVLHRNAVSIVYLHRCGLEYNVQRPDIGVVTNK